MRREKHLFERVVDFRNLYLAFVGASTGRRDRPRVAEFEHLCSVKIPFGRESVEDGEGGF